jgi:hypothetical protein
MENPVDTLLHTNGVLSKNQLKTMLGNVNKRKLKYFIATSMHCSKADPLKYGSGRQGIRMYCYSPDPLKYAVRFVKVKKDFVDVDLEKKQPKIPQSAVKEETMKDRLLKKLTEVDPVDSSSSSDSDPEDYEIV